MTNTATHVEPSVTNKALTTATEAARWIRSTAQRTEHGLVWLPDPDQPQRTATLSAPATIYSGNAGIILFFLELARATEDVSYLDDAKLGADQLVATWRDVITFPAFLKIENLHLTFNTGLAGTAFVLAQVWQATDAAIYRETAWSITQHIVAAARPVGDAIEWIGATSAGLGDGAIILYLLWAARFFQDASLLTVASRAGRRIVEMAEPDARGGVKWIGFPVEQLGLPPNTYFPNFEFGTAGVAFVLAGYEETQDAAFLKQRPGASHVQAIATQTDDAARYILS
ncbi:MAG: hypothetical protein U0175_01770 [Caldilineaceae bacterium]